MLIKGNYASPSQVLYDCISYMLRELILVNNNSDSNPNEGLELVKYQE